MKRYVIGFAAALLLVSGTGVQAQCRQLSEETPFPILRAGLVLERAQLDSLAAAERAFVSARSATLARDSALSAPALEKALLTELRAALVRVRGALTPVQWQRARALLTAEAESIPAAAQGRGQVRCLGRDVYVMIWPDSAR